MTNKTIYNFKNIILSKKNKLKRSIFINNIRGITFSLISDEIIVHI